MTILRAGLATLFGAAMYISSVAAASSPESGRGALAIIGLCHAVAGYLELGGGTGETGKGISISRAALSCIITVASLAIAMVVAATRPLSIAVEFGDLALTLSVFASFLGVALCYWRSQRGSVSGPSQSRNHTLA